MPDGLAGILSDADSWLVVRSCSPEQLSLKPDLESCGPCLPSITVICGAVELGIQWPAVNTNLAQINIQILIF